MELRSSSIYLSNTRRSLQAAPIPWHGLPLLVQQQILTELNNDYNRDLAEDRTHRAAYVAVCLEWQEYFEASAANFGKLALPPSALDEFQKIIQRRQDNGTDKTGGHVRSKKRPEAVPLVTRPMPRIRHIWLRIELREYDCENCKRRETDKEVERNNIIFTSALWKLLDMLSTWEKSDINHRQNLTLDISAHSPSDSQHMFQNTPEIQNTYPYLAEDNLQRQYMIQHRSGIITDHSHKLRSGRSITVPMAERLIQPLNFDFLGVRFKAGQSKDRLPEVKMVTSFLIRRQYYRDICTSVLDRLLGESLTNLRSIRDERWRLPDDLSRQIYDWEYGPTQDFPSGGRSTLASKMPSSLESLHIFEDFNATVHGPETSRRPRPSGIQVLKGLAMSTPGIKHVSLSFLSDAMDCLGNLDSMFTNLESIALTSQTYVQPTRHSDFNKLLHEAALAAMKMPKLQIMEIWNCENGHAAIFRYEATGTTESSACRLTWRCSWYPAPIWDRVVKAWENVAATVPSRRLILDLDSLPPGSYPAYGFILGQLKLRSSILDPISQMQVRVGTGSADEVDTTAWKRTTPYLPGVRIPTVVDTSNDQTATETTSP